MSVLDDVRDWVGSEPVDDVIYDAVDRFSAESLPAERAALSILRRRYADATTDRGFAVAGDYSQTQLAAGALGSLTGSIRRLEALLGETPAPLDTLASAPVTHRPASTVRSPGRPRRC